ncbi:MAG: DUF4124 domain-containing protein [Zoogloeaceae bacterium]|nr:DUF4124 domain-containing protein [Zoogloeaceae bacterium]
MHNCTLWMALGLVSALALPSAQAEIYRCVDAEGRLSYTNVPDMTGCTTANVPPDVSIPAPTIPPQTKRAAPQGNAAGQAPQTQVTAEQAALDQAKKTLEEQQAVRYGNERNYQKKLDRLKPYEDAVHEHEEKLKTLQGSSSVQ